MKEIKDKKWASNVKEGTNTVIETDIGEFKAFVSRSGWASAFIDEETTYNFGISEYKVKKLLDNYY